LPWVAPTSRQLLGVEVNFTMAGSYSSGLTPGTQAKLTSKFAPLDGTLTLEEFAPGTAHT
jgi:hypothetical protein